MTRATTLDLRENDYRRHYAIGDIHANMNDLATLIALIYEDGYDDRIDALFFLGDYIDSYLPGEADKVVKTVREMSKHPDVHALRGNHEQLLIDAIPEKMYTPEFMVWWSQGGENTFKAYSPDHKKSDEWHSRLITTKAMRSDMEWFKTLPTLAITNDYYFVHAGLDPIMAEATGEEDRLWIRDRFLTSGMDYGKLVVHGHTSKTNVEVMTNRINTDTSKYGRVSAVRLQKGREHLFFDRYGKYKVNERGECFYVDSSSGVEL